MRIKSTEVAWNWVVVDRNTCNFLISITSNYVDWIAAATTPTECRDVQCRDTCPSRKRIHQSNPKQCQWWSVYVQRAWCQLFMLFFDVWLIVLDCCEHVINFTSSLHTEGEDQKWNLVNGSYVCVEVILFTTICPKLLQNQTYIRHKKHENKVQVRGL